ncbi:unnamed protein product, partial [Brenthis ino]
MFFPIVIVFLFVLLLTVFLYDHCNRSRRLASKIPGPKAFPIIGNSFHFLRPPVELFKFIQSLSIDYGVVFSLYAINGRVIGVAAPELIETILSSVQYNGKRLPYIFLKPWLSEGLLVSNGQKWQQRRKLLTQAFHFNILKKYARTFTEKTEEFLALVQEKVGEAKTDVAPLVTFATLHIMCETAMGTTMQDDIDTIANKYLKAIEILGNSVVHRMVRIWLHFDSIFKWSTMAKVQKKALEDLHVFTTRIIRERRNFLKVNNINVFNDADDDYGKKGKLGMLDLLLENEKLGKIDCEGIREEVDTFMFEDKIYQEMHSIFGDSQRLPTLEDLSGMKYLELCIKESLRLYPSVPIIQRHVNEETTLGNYTIPADSDFCLPIYALHHCEDIYPDAEQFIPERFLPENCEKRHAFAYLPFSAGPRNCIGQKFAMLEMKTVVSSLIRRFRLEPVTKPSDLTFKPIPATAANLIEISQLRRRYYSAQVYAQTQVHSLFLSLSYSGGTTARHDQ